MKVSKYESIDHPKHYGNGRQVIDVIEMYGIGFHLGNALKYLARAGKKPETSIIEDAKKALWYMERRKHKMGATLEMHIIEDIQELTDHFIPDRGQIRDVLFYLLHQVGKPKYKHLNKAILILQTWIEQNKDR